MVTTMLSMTGRDWVDGSFCQTALNARFVESDPGEFLSDPLSLQV